MTFSLQWVDGEFEDQAYLNDSETDAPIGVPKSYTVTITNAGAEGDVIHFVLNRIVVDAICPATPSTAEVGQALKTAIEASDADDSVVVTGGAEVLTLTTTASDDFPNPNLDPSYTADDGETDPVGTSTAAMTIAVASRHAGFGELRKGTRQLLED